MANPEIRKFDGLYLQANSFNVPDGALEIADNIVIQSDDIISKTKGYFEYWRPGGGDTLLGLKGMFTYQNKLMGAFSNGIGSFTDTFPYGGAYNSRGTLNANTGHPCGFSKAVFFAKANSNLYATGLDGIYRLEAFDSKVRKAGVAPGLSTFFSVVYTDDGVLGPDSQTAYRVTFGRRDINGNLLESAPSDVEYVGIPALQGPPTLATPLVGTLAYTIASGVVTFNPDSFELYLRSGQTIFVTNATNTALNGSHVLTTATFSSATFTTAQPNGTGFLSYSVYGTPTIVADIPSELTDVLNEKWFARFYRTPSSLTVATDPTPTFNLVIEIPLTENDILSKQIAFTDEVDQALVGAGEELYTDANSREGELQANVRPPQANVMTQYKGYMLYGDVQTIQRLHLDLSNADSTSHYDIIFTSDGITETYRAKNSGVTVFSSPTKVTATGTGAITITDPDNIPFVGDTFLLTTPTGTILPGVYTVIAQSGSTYTISAPGKTMTAGTVEFLTNDGVFVYEWEGDQTPSQNIETTAKSLVRSINRNSAFMYANYVSSFSDFPGSINFQSKTVRGNIYARRSDSDDGFDYPQPFIQPLPNSFSTGTQIYSENDILQNGLFWSKIGEPEAVPVLNFSLIGEATGRLLQAIPLRDCVIIIKADGAFKLTGDVASDFVITPLDTTIKFNGDAIRCAAEINNVAIGMSNQGVVKATENGVQVISRRIDDVIQPLVGRTLSSTFLGGNEGDRLFYINTSGINAGDDDVCYVYNILNETWTKSNEVFTHLSLGPDDATFGILFDAEAGSDVIHRQRKTQTLVDYTGKYLYGSITIDADKKSGEYTILGGNSVTPSAGDALLYDGVFSRITKASLGAGVYNLEFSQPTNIPLVGSTNVILYKAYTSTFKMAPFHAGQIGLEKHFSQMQMQLRQAAITDVTLTFGGEYFGSSEITKWSLTNITSEGSTGWGYSPWGFFPWGLAQGIKLSAGTRSSSIIRTYVPRFAARNTFIQLTASHTVAGQPMLVQGIVYTCRGYGDRTSK